MSASFRKFLQVLQVFCKFLQGFALFIFSFYIFWFCFFLFYFFINLFYFDTLQEQNPYFLALCKKTNPDFFDTLQLFWHFARTLTQLSQFLNLQHQQKKYTKFFERNCGPKSFERIAIDAKSFERSAIFRKISACISFEIFR